jgi:mannitol-specific phosphotransferase system IIBC component
MIGLSILVKANKKTKNKEKYSMLSSAKNGGVLATNIFLNIIGLIFLMMEFILIFYNVNIVLKCTKPGVERIVNMFLAIIIPIPYAFGNILFNKCASEIF